MDANVILQYHSSFLTEFQKSFQNYNIFNPEIAKTDYRKCGSVVIHYNFPARN